MTTIGVEVFKIVTIRALVFCSYRHLERKRFKAGRKGETVYCQVKKWHLEEHPLSGRICRNVINSLLFNSLVFSTPRGAVSSCLAIRLLDPL